MNKKLASIVMSTATLLSGVVLADCEPKLYVGAEAQLSHMTHLVRKAWVGGGAFLGTRLNENLGLEAGYTFLGKESVAVWPVQGQLKFTNAYVDLMGYLPLNCASDLIASVGVGYLKADLKFSVLRATFLQGNDHAVGVRAGVGAQYKFTDNIGARVMVGYQHAKDVHVVAGKLGMFYQF